MKARGFTLVELIVVITITGIVAAMMTVFLKPTIDGYFDVRRRADLTDQADTALRRMAQDIRSAVPNSVRLVSSSCFQLAPTITGGRYRMDTDTVTAGSAALDTSVATTSFDVLSPMSQVPSANDWVVVGNQSPDQIYAASNPNRGQISAVTSPATGQHRIALAPTQFSTGYDGGRFVVVPNATQTIFYSCVGGTLYRTTAAFGANQATTCAATSGAVVATGIPAGGCTFVYDPGAGATQQTGLVWMRLEIASGTESVTLAHGVHLDNVP